MSKPANLLVIHTDQQSCWSLSAYGGTLVSTPHIDSLADEGAIFTNFFTNSAVCTPSRGCFVTGRYPHAHGAYRNNISLNRDEVTFAQVLMYNGYDTGYAGKWHLDGTPRPGWVHPDRTMGFADAAYMFNRGHWKKIEGAPMGDMEPIVYPYQEMGDERTYTTDWLTDKTIEFLERPRENPFCYMVSIPDPHSPYRPRAPYDDMFASEDMPVPDTLTEAGGPRWLEGHRQAPDAEKLRQLKAWYCGEVKLIDDCVGRMLDCLRQQGLLDDTIVVFTADHGDYMGEHGLMGKNLLYETAYRIPMLVRWPKAIPAGSMVDHIASTVDFQQTVLGLMGVAPCGREQGRDASPLLRGEDMEWEDVAYLHHASLNQAGIFTPEFELAYVRGSDPILFDRANDPDQVNNLFGSAACRSIVDELTDRIIDHNVAVQAPAAAWLEALRR